MNYKILMVDDDRELLKMLNQYFTLKNYTVIIAENGIEAMEKISVNPDIILLDVNMPGMDGIEVCRRIRDMVSCPIIFLTAKVEEQDGGFGRCSKSGVQETNRILFEKDQSCRTPEKENETVVRRDETTGRISAGAFK